MSKFANAINAAAEQEDINEATAGGDFVPLPEGPCRLRFAGYIELGKHEKEWQGVKKDVDKAKFIFEVSGPKIEPREDGQPHLLQFELNKSKSEKAGYFKLFRKMNVSGKHKVFAQMLGEGFRGKLRQNIVGEGADKRTYVNLTDEDGSFQIAAPYYNDEETGDRKEVSIPPMVSPERCFIWAFPDKEQWDSLFIDGEWEARDGKPAKSKNIYQERIKSAKDWVGSPMQELLFGDIDVGDVEKPERDEGAKEDSADAKAAAAKARQKAAADVDPLADDDIPF